MTLDNFKTQMDRIKEQFGEKHYSKERLNIIWNSLRNTRDELFVAACDELIANKNQAPVLKDFIDSMSRAERAERELRINSQRMIEPVIDFTPDTELAEFCNQVIKDTLAGRLTPEQRAEADKFIDSMIENKEKQRLLEKQGDKK